jgi:molybdopterin-guanine dinucleotide biosynthesis protein A
MVKGSGAKAWKDSARQVSKYADRIVTWKPTSFDFDIDQIGLIDGRWVIREKATAIIMAGGRSTRMGHDKSLLPLKTQQPAICDASKNNNARPMIQHIFDQLRPCFNQILISSDDTSRYAFLGAPVIADRMPGQGPLMGIASALAASDNEVNLVIACDIPEVDIALVRTMLRRIRGYDAVVPKTGPSQYEPLFAVYKKRILKALENALSSGQRRIIDALSPCRVKYLDLTGTGCLRNLNTMQDYLKFIGGQKDVIT